MRKGERGRWCNNSSKVCAKVVSMRGRAETHGCGDGRTWIYAKVFFVAAAPHSRCVADWCWRNLRLRD